ncbi:MAG: pirin family protein [bacterium]
MSIPSPIAHVIEGAARDAGGSPVRRLLPQAAARSVGPFVFFDHFGPAEVDLEGGMQIRPHPHIGLATVTWLFEGAIQHRDSLGYDHRIEPGALNWMTAGRGIAHSERTPADLAGVPHRLHGLQVWVGLPSADEETEPSFHHHPPSDFPSFPVEGATLRVLVGEAYGRRSPARTFSPIFYVDAQLAAGAPHGDARLQRAGGLPW